MSWRTAHTMMKAMRTSMAATNIPKTVKKAAFVACTVRMGAPDMHLSG